MKSDATVYIVDDDHAMCESLRWLVESVNYHVKTYCDASDFLKEYNAQNAGCLLLDVRMPELGGLDLQIYLHQNNIQVPIIFLSGHGDIQTAVKAMKYGAIDFLTKPFSDQILLDSINYAVNKDKKRLSDLLLREEIGSCIHKLSSREREVLDLLVLGKSNKISASILGVSIKTIELHRANVMKKMEASSLSALIIKVLSYESNNFTFYQKILNQLPAV